MMPRGKTKTAAQLQAEIKRLEAQLEQKKQVEQASKLQKSKEFKSVRSAISELGLSDQEILALFKDDSAAGKPGRKPARKAGKKTTRKKAAAKKSTKKAKAGKSSSKDKRAVVEPKYQHPENKELVWSGRGRQAKWVTEALASGKTLADLEVKRD